MTDVYRTEIFRAPQGPYRCALFDFDGTVSLIRAGWQSVMIPYFCEVVSAAAPGEDGAAIRAEVKGFVDGLTGKQTIYQCMALCDAVRARGGAPLSPGDYKAEYLRRLEKRIASRKAALENGAPPEDYAVPGALAFVRALADSGAVCYLASGTDEADVKREAALLGIADAFRGGIFGARDALTDCSKEAVIRRLLKDEAIPPEALLGFGDGFVEIGLVREAGGYAVGVAVNETDPAAGIDDEKRARLLRAGADMILRDFTDRDTLAAFLR